MKPEREFLHDISNPITIAQGNVDLLLKKLQTDPTSVSPDKLLSQTEKISNAIARAVALIKDRKSEVSK